MADRMANKETKVKVQGDGKPVKKLKQGRQKQQHKQNTHTEKRSHAPTHTSPREHKTQLCSVCCSLAFFVLGLQFENQG